MTHDLAIVGAGPAGASAAVFAARAKLDTLLVDADQGMTRRAQIWNHLGLPDGITGPELVDRGLAHAEKAGAKLAKAKLTTVQKTGDVFTLTAEDGRTFQAKQVLLTLGANPALGVAAGAKPKPGTEPHIKEVLVVDAEGRTTVPGIWAAGTCAGSSVHTIITAGEGARVVINLVSALQGKRWVDHDSLK